MWQGSQMETGEVELARYITRVHAIPELSRDEEVRLARAFRDEGSIAAAESLILPILRSVVIIAIRYRRYGVPFSELIAAGNMGALYAVRTYDPESGNRFITCASYRIRGAILQHIIDSWSIVGASDMQTRLFFRLRRERARIVAFVSDDAVGDALLAERLETSAKTVGDVRRRLEARDVSLGAALFEDGTGSRMDMLAADGPDQAEQLSRAEERQLLRDRVPQVVQTLDPRERYIVEMRLMVDPEEALSLAEIGRRLGFSRERARQIEVRAKKKLRDRLGSLRDQIE